MYTVQNCARDFEDDFTDVIKDLSENSMKAKRLVVYCRLLDMCAKLYAHFHLTLGDSSYYPPGSPKLSGYRLFGMYHSKTPQHNKGVIISSLTKDDGVVRVVFAAMGFRHGNRLSLRLSTTVLFGQPMTTSKSVVEQEEVESRQLPLYTGAFLMFPSARTTITTQQRFLL